MHMRLSMRGGGVVRCVCVILVALSGAVQPRTVIDGRKGAPRHKVCSSDDFLLLQETCRKQNDDMLLAEKMHHQVNKLLCKKLVGLFYCVAGHVPLCFHNLTDIYKSYFHSPHNCALSPQEIRSLQDLTISTAQRQANGQPQDVNVEVDIIIPDSTPSPRDHTPREGEGEKEEEGGRGSGHQEHSKTDRHSHSGAPQGPQHAFCLSLILMMYLGVRAHLLS